MNHGIRLATVALMALLTPALALAGAGDAAAAPRPAAQNTQTVYLTKSEFERKLGPPPNAKSDSATAHCRLISESDWNRAFPDRRVTTLVRVCWRIR